MVASKLVAIIIIIIRTTTVTATTVTIISPPSIMSAAKSSAFFFLDSSLRWNDGSGDVFAVVTINPHRYIPRHRSALRQIGFGQGAVVVIHPPGDQFLRILQDQPWVFRVLRAVMKLIRIVAQIKK